MRNFIELSGRILARALKPNGPATTTGLSGGAWAMCGHQFSANCLYNHCFRRFGVKGMMTALPTGRTWDARAGRKRAWDEWDERFEASAALNYRSWSIEAVAIIAAERNALAVQGMWHWAGSCRFLPRSV
jgi:hypothetical protein